MRERSPLVDFLELANWQDFPPKEGSIMMTCILQWSLDELSFWRSPSMAAVFDIAKSIALTGWKEAGQGIVSQNSVAAGGLVMESSSRKS